MEEQAIDCEQAHIDIVPPCDHRNFVRCIKQMIVGGLVDLPNGDDELSQVLRELFASWQTSQQLNQYLLTNLQSVVERSTHLQEHAYRANQGQDQAVSEITTRSSEIEQTLKVTSEHVAHSIDQTTRITDEMNNTISSVETSLVEKLDNVRHQLEEKTSYVAEIMEDIHNIGFRLNLLALNAAVEAAHAGELGKGFSIVAQEVKNLARHASKRSSEVAKHMDLESVQSGLNEVLDDTRNALENTQGEVQSSIHDLQERFTEMDAQIEKIGGINSVMFEIIDLGKSSLDHALAKIKWSKDTLTPLLKLPVNDSDSSARLLDRLLVEQHIPNRNDISTDRLSEIKARGSLRVAVEPSFVGLSFRPHPNDELQGLDVEYAKGLAEWLGVDCEFIEYPWDQITELLVAGPAPGKPAADVICSALPPSADYSHIAYSDTYTYLHWVLARSKDDMRIKSVQDLEGKVLGIINDPGAFAVLEQLGVRWKGNENLSGGKIRLAQLVAYNDQNRIHDCLTEGLVDAFAVDLPIYHWACSNPQSRWYEKIEIIPGNLAAQSYYYTMAVHESAGSYRLLHEINQFITWFKEQPNRLQIENFWQGAVVDDNLSYRDEEGDLPGEPELAARYKRLVS